jgi:hypothetical protein
VLSRRAGAGAGARARRRATRALATLTLALAAGCAPHVTQLPGPDAAQVPERYRVALAARTARAAAADLALVMWAEAPPGHKLPGAEGRLLLAAPDAFRLRVASLFGTALDLGVRGESLIATVPSRRQAVSLDAVRDTLGIANPGRLAFRTLAAAWQPPAAAWEGAVARGAMLELSWCEGGDTLALTIDRDGKPAHATYTRAEGSGVRVDYQGWDGSGGVSWPARFTIADLDGNFRVACKVSRVRFVASVDSLRLRVPIPPDFEPLTVAELRRTLERMGAP